MAPAGQEAHRSGLLKQSNKGHKTGSHRSKGEIDRSNKGRTGLKASTIGSSKARKVESRMDRRNRYDQNLELKLNWVCLTHKNI